MPIPKRIAALFSWLLAAGLGALAAYTDSLAVFIVAILAGGCGVLFAVQHALVQRQMALSSTEISTYGAELSEATAEILALSEKKMRAHEIAERIKTTYGVPIDITLKYIIALGKYGDDRL
jgi:hypothetical protein